MSSHTWAKDEPVTLKVGVVPQFPVQELRLIWDPLMVAIAKRLDVHITFVGSPSIPAFEKKLALGEFDIVYLNAYQMLQSNENQGYVPLVKDVGRFLRGILVARKDSGITDIKQLEDQIVAFPAPSALGASLLVRAELANLHHINIKPRYVKTHSSTYLNVLLGEAKAGGGVEKTFGRQAQDIQEALRIIYRTEKVASHPIAVHPRVPKELQDKLKNILLQLGNTPDGRAILAKVPIKKIGEASMEDYLPVKKMDLKQFIER